MYGDNEIVGQFYSGTRLYNACLVWRKLMVVLVQLCRGTYSGVERRTVRDGVLYGEGGEKIFCMVNQRGDMY